MSVTRRKFLQNTGVAAAGAFSGGLSLLTGCRVDPEKLKGSKKVNTVCPGCSLGCGITVFVRNNRLIDISGDREHPVNEGAVCVKAGMVRQFADDPANSRLKEVLYRKPGSSKWEQIPLANAIKMIAERIKDTRDRTFIKTAENTTYNRTDSIAFLAGDWLYNEEHYLFGKLARILGINNIDHESSVYSASTGVALSETLGFHASTNPLTDIDNSDIILVAGSNPVENYPLVARHLMRARDRGGRVITIDPRYTRTSAISDMHISIRPGTDTAFLNGIINYVLKNSLYSKKFISGYTNASYLINPEFSFEDGLFSGYNSNNGSYDNITWTYQIDAKGIPKRDRNMKNPHTVFQLLKNHVSRYTPGMVADITGCSAADFLRVAELYSETGRSDKSASIIFSSGLTSNLSGTQTVRAFAILQLILGNIGVSGGGLIYLGRRFNDRGAADNGTGWGTLPGYIHVPRPELHPDFASYLENTTPRTNDTMSYNVMGTDGSIKGNGNTNRFMINILKAWYGSDSTDNPDDLFNWLPKSSEPFRYSDFFNKAESGKLEGALLINTDPVKELPGKTGSVGALKNLRWMACGDYSETGISSFWKEDGAVPEKIMTEVFLFPLANPFEKEGSVTNNDRWIQWCSRALNPPDETLSGLEFIDSLYLELRRLYGTRTGAFPMPLLGASWNYSGKNGKADPLAVLREINGIDTKTNMPLETYRQMKDDGSTMCGNWLYSGCVNIRGNRTERRDSSSSGEASIHSNWGWSWPQNTRVLYNMAGVNRKGIPVKKNKAVIEWEGSRWSGDNPAGDWIPGSKYPFIKFNEGMARIFSPLISDGPLPEFYESPVSLVKNPFNSRSINPAYGGMSRERNMKSGAKFPYIGTVVRTGDYSKYSLSGNLPWEKELVPEMFSELSYELASGIGVRSGELIRVITDKGFLIMPVMVTGRLKPLIINGKEKHIISVVNSGDAINPVNMLLHGFADPYTGIIETGLFMVNIEKMIKVS